MLSNRWGTRAVVTIALGAGVAGCWPVDLMDDCEKNVLLDCFWDRFNPAGSSSSSSGGGGGSTPTECIPSEAGAPVGDGCGVFVATSGDDANAGSQAKPVATLVKAIELAAKAKGRVYVCAETFEKPLTLDNGIELYGGLDCANGWAYVGDTKKTTLTAGADAIPLLMKSGASGAKVVDFAIHAVDAVKEGGSSIAVLAQGAAAEFVRCELAAGNGAKGAPGMPGDPNGMSAMAGAAGNAGKDACTSAPLTDPTPGGKQVTNDCGGSDVSVGGRGGDGDVALGGDALAGKTGTKGQAGLGEPAAGAWDCSAGSGLGATGSLGDPGMPGAGAVGPGELSIDGYKGTSGGDGTSGKAGQGGGGGGGAKGGMICAGGVAGSGASGGSGGAGGCGGLPGTGGGPGGASIALISLQGTISLTDCTLLTTKGGDGGLGGDAQGGGPGGKGGDGGMGVGVSNPGCSGGQGGKGGNGGPGGGGLGGPSIGIAFSGNPVDMRGTTSITPGQPGAGGPGGSANVAMNAGAVGVQAETQEMP